MKNKFRRTLLSIFIIILVAAVVIAGLFNNLWLPTSSVSMNPEDIPKMEGLITIPEDYSYPSKNSLGVKSINNTAFEIFKHYPSNRNTLFSPAGLALSLGHLQSGASESSRSEIVDFLFNKENTKNVDFSQLNESFRDYIKYISNYDSKADMLYGNSIWYESKRYSAPKEDFLKLSNDFFYSEVYPTNFSGDPKGSMKKLNTWVQNKTRGAISSIMTRVPKDYYMSLINTIYFKGSWEDEFKHRYTKNREFTTPNGKIKTKTMCTNEELQYLEGNNFSAVRKFYKDRHTSMTIVLPDENTTLENLISSLDTQWWDNLDSKINSHEVLLYLPKFKFEFSQMLNEPLESCNVKKIFKGEDDPLINIAPDIFVSVYMQKSFIKVDEKGTEAAAVTVAENTKSARDMKPITFRVDRPFLFFISDEGTNSILFMGTVNDPSK